MGRLVSTGVKPVAYVKLPNVDITTNTQADSNKSYWIDTTGGGISLTLPPSPVKGDIVRIYDIANNFGTDNLTVARNGNPIMETAEDLTVNTDGAAFELVFYDGTYGWRIFSI